MKKLVNWVIAFLNNHPDLAGYLCDLGIAHKYNKVNERCNYCEKKKDGWDFFWYFNI